MAGNRKARKNATANTELVSRSKTLVKESNIMLA
jgi:hypothetical protein